MDNQSPNNPYASYDVVRASQQDGEHLSLLAIAYYVLAGLTVVGAIGSALYFGVMGTVFSNMASQIGPMTTPPDPKRPEPTDLPMHAIVGPDNHVIAIAIAVLIIGILLAALFICAARCIQLRKNAVLVMVAAGLVCLHFPLGTVLGVLTFVVLNRPSVKAMFGRSPSPGQGYP
jgi:hypothetical protein